MRKQNRRKLIFQIKKQGHFEGFKHRNHRKNKKPNNPKQIKIAKLKEQELLKELYEI